MTKANTYGIKKEELYTLNEVAEILKVGQRSLYNFIKDGRLKAVKAGREWRVSGEALIGFLETNGGKA